MKNFLRGLIILVVFILLANCEKEEFFEKSDELPELRVKRVKLHDLQQNQSLSEKIKAISNSLDINKENTFKSGDIDSNDGTFTILTDEIVEV